MLRTTPFSTLDGRSPAPLGVVLLLHARMAFTGTARFLLTKLAAAAALPFATLLHLLVTLLLQLPICVVTPSLALGRPAFTSPSALRFL